MKGFVVYPTYKIENNEARVYLFGRLEDGKSFLVKRSFRPYFFIPAKDLEKAKSLGTFSSEATTLQNLDRQQVVKIVLSIPKDVPELRKRFADEGIPSYEADIRFAYRFLLDHDIKGGIEISGNGEPGDRVDMVFDEPDLQPARFMPTLRTLSFDIETDSKGKQLYAISLYSADRQLAEVLLISDKKLRNTTSYPDEKSLLRAFTQKLLAYDPDIITGWNVIDFDLKVLKALYEKHHLPFSFGRIDWDNRLRLTDDFFRASSADIPGRMVLDGITLLKDSFIRIQDYKLNTAAQVFLGERKLVEGTERYKEIERMFAEDQQKLADYNLQDSRLVIDILEKSGVVKLSILRSLLTGMQLDRVRASIASLDGIYLPLLRKRGYVAPTSVYTEKAERIKGGFVRESKPGIYDHVIVLDFKSLYPSIMRTFNIDPLSFVPHPPKHLDKKEYIRAPNGAVFRNDDGLLPSILQDLWRQRDKAKQEKDKLASHAIKILMNSFFGVLASPNCRFFSLEMSNGITHFGQHFIKMTAERIEKQGYDVIYGDTDSIFVSLDVKDAKEAERIGLRIQDEINVFFRKHISEHYHRESFMELEFEKIYRKFLMPKQRGSDRGSKKRYAGLLIKDGKEEMSFVGLEFVRRDWTALAKEFQLNLLGKVFHDEPVADYVRKFVVDLRSGKHDDLLVYRKALRKGLAEYTKTTPPHVKAARKMKKVTSSIIEYVMTLNGPEPLESLKSPIDYDHYIEKQLKPIADSILGFYGETFEHLSGRIRQQTLEGF
ncbi:MAG: DNA polymerase II [DPANN group archaeon]|nr:DNA polymerase II [DPANN group archaeon]